MRQRFFEDIVTGTPREFGSHTITEEDITEFAQNYDPQPFHIDDEAARHSIFGGLIASGWYTAAVMMRMFVEHELHDCATIGSPGFDDLRWLQPVRPGDTLRVRATCIDKQPSRSQPGLGSLRYEIHILNQHDETVASLVYIVLVQTRDSQPRRP